MATFFVSAAMVYKPFRTLTLEEDDRKEFFELLWMREASWLKVLLSHFDDEEELATVHFRVAKEFAETEDFSTIRFVPIVEILASEDRKAAMMGEETLLPEEGDHRTGMSLLVSQKFLDLNFSGEGFSRGFNVVLN